MKKIITLEIPEQLDLLCQLLEIAPEQVIQGFINDVSMSTGSNGSDERFMSADYFLRCGYGMHIFDYQQQEQMLNELNTIRYNFYLFGNKQMAAYKRYRRKEIKDWYQRWNKIKRDNL